MTQSTSVKYLWKHITGYWFVLLIFSSMTRTSSLADNVDLVLTNSRTFVDISETILSTNWAPVLSRTPTVFTYRYHCSTLPWRLCQIGSSPAGQGQGPEQWRTVPAHSARQGLLYVWPSSPHTGSFSLEQWQPTAMVTVEFFSYFNPTNPKCSP